MRLTILICILVILNSHYMYCTMLKKKNRNHLIMSSEKASWSCCIQENQGETHWVGQSHGNSSWHAVAPWAAEALFMQDRPTWNEYWMSIVQGVASTTKWCHLTLVAEFISSVITNICAKKNKNYNVKTVKGKNTIGIFTFNRKVWILGRSITDVQSDSATQWGHFYLSVCHGSISRRKIFW